jgi:hypothetical protein
MEINIVGEANETNGHPSQESDVTVNLAGKVGCWHVKTRVKMTDMCLSGQRVADMLAGMSATQHQKLLAGVPGRHVTASHLLTCRQYVGNMTNI